MEQPTRKSIFALASKKLRADFEEARNVPHAGLRGQEGEGIVRDFLNNHLPKRFGAGSGFLIDHGDHISKQSDIVIYDALNCPVYRASNEAAIFPCNNVAAVIEVKSNLDKEKLNDAAEKIKIAKELVKNNVPLGAPFLIQWETIGIVFAFQTKLKLETLLEHYADTIKQLGGLGRHIDYIFVLDFAMLSIACKVPNETLWAPTLILGSGGNFAEGSHLGIGATEMGDKVLDTLLRTILVHLQHFREMMDHPGFDWASTREDGKVMIRYLTSVTLEKDPAKRADILARYREQVRQELEGK